MAKRWAMLALAAGCGTSASSASVVGTVHGQALTPTDAISATASVALASGTVPAAALIFSDAGALCTKVTANQEPASARALLLFLADADPVTGGITAAAGTGTWSIFIVGSGNPPAHFAVASFGVNDEACHQIAAQSAGAVAGTVTLTRNDSSSYAGSYDLTFDSGDRVTGSFDTAACRGLATFLGSKSHACG
jgi:hypothetical protein